MKTLVDYIKESCEEKKEPCTKKISFNFTDFEGAEDVLKSAQEIADKDGVEIEVEDNKLSFSVSKEKVEKFSGLIELLQDYIQLRGHDSKRASNEAYAQKVQKCEKTLNSYFEFLDDIKDEEETKEKETKEEETKEEETKENDSKSKEDKKEEE